MKREQAKRGQVDKKARGVRILARAASLLAVFLLNCGGDDSSGTDTKSCEPNATRTCVGPGACAGGQFCDANGNWSNCDCAGGTGGTNNDGGGAAGGGGSGGFGATAGSGTGGGTAGSGGSSGATQDGGADGGPLDCTSKFGSKMINIENKFCIDQREATYAEYKLFYDDTLVTPFTQSAECISNVLKPSSTMSTAIVATPDFAAGHVSWCDAQGFCKWAGKRLCGKFGGGGLTGNTYEVPQNQFIDAQLSEWVYACSNGGTTRFPYGDTTDLSKCSSATSTGKPMAAPNCHGLALPYSELFDMSWNASEWVNGIANAGRRVRMGTVDELAEIEQGECKAAQGVMDGNSTQTTGIRCCR